MIPATDGGRDPGAVYQSRREADDVLALSQAVAAGLRTYAVDVAESRTEDQFVSLAERVDRSNKREDDLFVSLHRNAFRPEAAQGVETFIHPYAGPVAVAAAQCIQQRLAALGFVDRGVKRRGFFVLERTRAPAVLVEVGFVDNTQDNLRFDLYREQIAQALVEPIVDQLGVRREPVVPSVDEAISLLAQRGVLESSAYWEQYARPGQTVRGEYAARLIQRMAAELQRSL